MKLHLITAAVLALLGAALLAPPAQAQTYTTGDLLLGFTEVNGGALPDYVINIGNVSNYINATGTSTVTIGVGNTAANLTTAFGSGWQTNSNLLWSAGATTNTSAGTGALTGFAANTVWLSGDPNNPVPLNSSSGGQGTPRGDINTIGVQFRTGTLASGNAIIQSGGTANDYAQVGDSGSGNNIDFGFGFDLTSSFANGTAGTSLNLYQLIPGPPNGQPGTLLGTFNINDSGTITFTSVNPAVVPEPSTYALMILGAGLLFWQLKRRNAINS